MKITSARQAPIEAELREWYGAAERGDLTPKPTPAGLEDFNALRDLFQSRQKP